MEGFAPVVEAVVVQGCIDPGLMEDEPDMGTLRSSRRGILDWSMVVVVGALPLFEGIHILFKDALEELSVKSPLDNISGCCSDKLLRWKSLEEDGCCW
jgi:hypothetical protein